MRLLGLIPVALLAACQTYDFEPVTPSLVGQTTDSSVIARRRLEPNVMLLVDRSLSMLRPIEPEAPTCPAGCGSSVTTACPADCATRMSELKSAMGSFLETSKGLARFGAAQYPSSSSVCAGADEINVPFERGEQVSSFIQSLSAMGGTPLAASLQFVGEHAELNADDGRDDFVLLLTDGLPNCSGVNPSALDADAAVEQVKNLRAKGIRTIVVGFGADLLSGEAPNVLNAIAREGGFSPSYFQARDAAELTAALTVIVDNWETCTFSLSARPSDPRYLAVLVDGTTLTEGSQTFQYDFARNEVTFTGAMCERVEASTSQHPVQVEFRIVERF